MDVTKGHVTSHNVRSVGSVKGVETYSVIHTRSSAKTYRIKSTEMKVVVCLIFMAFAGMSINIRTSCCILNVKYQRESLIVRY